MILSMTGYGRSNVLLENINYTVELKALNSKTTDIRCKMPATFAEREMQIRKLITDEVVRGRVEFNIFTGDDNASDDYNINTSLLVRFFNQLKALQGEINIADADIFTAVMRIPSVTQSIAEPISDEDYARVELTMREAITSLTRFRMDEGLELATDLKSRVLSIQEKLSRVGDYEGGRIVRIRERLRKNLEEFIQSERIDVNRFEQEIIYYLEKIDITEEKVRLNQHCNYFIEQLDNKETQVGKILAFIAQEMGREINTLGAKAQDSELQQLVVLMKDELEKIKEQLANIL
ncbi:MAG: YicC family protein [Saprospiraceae bacterium]|nr:YicC family protein [Saprospiraceae bacterium]